MADENRTNPSLLLMAILAIVVGGAIVAGRMGMPWWGIAIGVPLGIVLLLALWVFAIVIRSRFRQRRIYQAMALYKSGDLDGAILVIERAIDARPDLPELWNTLGALRGQQKRYEEALSALARAAELGGDEASILANRAWILWKLDRFDEALELNSFVLERYPRLFSAAANQCVILMRLGRRDEAAEQLRIVEEQYESETVLSQQERESRRNTMNVIRKNVNEASPAE